MKVKDTVDLSIGYIYKKTKKRIYIQLNEHGKKLFKKDKIITKYPKEVGTYYRFTYEG